jgi:ribosomal protein S12 methylthiotransferase accessory factor
VTVRSNRSAVEAVIARAVDPHVGIIHDLRSIEPRAGAPRFFHCSAQLCNLSACGWEGNLTPLEAGAPSRFAAQASVLFEALGCYAAAFYAPHELELYSHRRAPERCVAPHRFALFSDEQYAGEAFPFEPFTDDTPVRWVPATSLESGSPSSVPAAAALLPYMVADGTGEAWIQPSSPIGLACACSRDEAVRSAICDVIKHDALAVCWNGQLSPPHVRIETLSDENYGLVERFEAIGRVTALNITLDTGVPAFLLCLECPADGAPAMVFGAGCDLDPDLAFRLALDDLALSLRLCQDVSEARERRAQADRDVVGPRLDRLAFWCEHAHRSYAAFLFASSERLEFEEVCAGEAVAPPGDSRGLAAALGAAGFEVFVVDLTTSDLRELDVSAVRAVIPGLQPLFGAPYAPALGGRRLREIPARLGLRPATPGMPTGLRETLPHPFVLRGIES